MFMKKIFLFLTAFMLSTGAFAQKTSAFAQSPFIKAETGILQKNVSATSVQQPVLHRAQLADNQLIMGGYTTDAYATSNEGIGLPSYPGTLRIAAELPVEDFQMFDGGKVVKIRVALANSATVSRVFITPVSTDGYIIGDIVSQAVNFNSTGWNEIELTTPVELDLSQYAELLLGFDYRQVSTNTNTAYPLSFVATGEKAYESVVYGNLGQGTGWYILGTTSYGNLSVQAVVEVDLPEQKVSVPSVSIDQYIKIGNTTTASFKVANLGQETINSVGFSYYIDGTKLGDNVANTTITSGETVAVPFNIAVPADLAAGSHTLKVELTTVNGATPKEVVTGTAQTDFAAYVNTAQRQKYLIEHITSWTCTYCYLGYGLLRNMESAYDDVAWVALHGNQSSSKDPYYFTEVDYVMNFLGANAFPTAAFDRLYLPDLAEGSELAYSIGYYEQYAAQMAAAIHGLMEGNAAPSFVTLDIDANFNADTRLLQVTVNGTGVEQAAQLLADQQLTIYLTEAGLTGRQYSNGSWQNNFEHNNTLRTILTSYTGDAITWNGDNFTYTKTYTVPADYVAENLSVVAFVAPQPSSNTKAMAVNNCEKVAVKTVATGIKNTITDGNATEVARYNAAGQVISEAQKGLNIIKLSNGKTVKVIVK